MCPISNKLEDLRPRENQSQSTTLFSKNSFLPIETCKKCENCKSNNFSFYCFLVLTGCEFQGEKEERQYFFQDRKNYLES